MMSDHDAADATAVFAQARARARERGRIPHRKCIGTPYVLKGLEFEHAVVVIRPGDFTGEELYVALTRASHSLTIISDTRRLRVRRASG